MSAAAKLVACGDPNPHLPGVSFWDNGKLFHDGLRVCALFGFTELESLSTLLSRGEVRLQRFKYGRGFCYLADEVSAAREQRSVRAGKRARKAPTP